MEGRKGKDKDGWKEALIKGEKERRGRGEGKERDRYPPVFLPDG